MSRQLSLAALTALLLLTRVSAVAEDSSVKSPARNPWKASVKIEGKGRYDSNIFLLSDHLETKLENAGPAEQVSGRFNDMNSVSDFIFTPSAKLMNSGTGVGGQRMAVELGAGYDIYFLNPRRRHFDFDFVVEQNISRNGRLRVKFDYLPSYFYRNYLADATNYTTSVTAAERVYKPDVYSDEDLTVDYRYRFADGRSWVTGRGGYLRRRNGAPFVGHDRNEPYGGGGIDFGLTKWSRLSGDYDYASVDCPHVQEVMILNEPDFGVDFNNDGDASQMSIRTVQWVNRSHHQQLIHATTRFGYSEGSSLSFNYERRLRTFLSKEPYDIYHNGRTDTRDSLGVTFTSHPGRNLQLMAGNSYSFQNANLPNDPGITGEVNSYKRNVAFVAMTYRF